MIDETTKEKIWFIAALSAAVTTLLPSIVFGLMWIVLSPIIFAFLCFITAPCLFIWHKIETAIPVSRPVQFLLICFLGSMVGFFVYLALFQPGSWNKAVTGHGKIIALSYMFPGVISAASAWTFYNFGPFKVYVDEQPKDKRTEKNKAELTPGATARIIGYIIAGAGLAWIFSDAGAAAYVPEEVLVAIEWAIKNATFALFFVIQPLIMIFVIIYAGYRALKYFKH